MSPVVTYTGRKVEIAVHTEWSLQEEEDLTFVGEELDERWEPDDYDVDPIEGEDE